MKIALCTTTIHVPHVLKLMREYSADVSFFVALDHKMPTLLVSGDEPWGDKAGTYALHPSAQERWKCSKALGWNTLARRNIAFLEALAWGADVIYSHDDDNIPMGSDHFGKLEDIFAEPFNGLLGSGKSGWFDPGHLLYPNVRHRGIPHDIPIANHYDIATNFRVGAAAGLVLGDPDIDATTRMERHPDTQIVSEAARSGVIIDVNTHTVFNTQNTAVIRELIPAWFLMPGVGRHDDIYASMIVQRVARERGYHVHFGPPFTYQQRNEHNLITDLRAEIDGMENVKKLSSLLDHIPLPGKSVIEDTRIIYTQLQFCEFLPQASVQAGLVWLVDCEGVM